MRETKKQRLSLPPSVFSPIVSAEMDFYSIQTEKAKAMARYRRLRNIAKIWRLIEIVIALSLVSWSSARLPSAAKFAVDLAGKISACFYAYAFNPLVNFAIFNTIILFLYLFSRQNHGTEEVGEEKLDLVVFTELDFEIHYPPAAPCAAEEAPEEREKRTVVVENEVTKEFEAVGVAIKEAKRQIRRFERTQSVNLKRDLQHGKPRHQLRRSGTDINMKRTVDERAISVIDRVRRLETDENVEGGVEERAISVIDRVDSLSSEEFQKTIDEFIARQQRFLLAQKMAEKQLDYI